MRILYTLGLGTALLIGLIGGLVADDWTTSQMVKDGVYPPGYHCERVMAIEFRQVP